MTPTEVLKMLKSKIDAAGLNKCNYAIETSDIEAINQALLLYDVSKSLLAAGKLALSARLVTTATAKNISQRIEKMESDLDIYDNEIVAASNVC